MTLSLPINTFINVPTQNFVHLRCCIETLIDPITELRVAELRVADVGSDISVCNSIQ